MLVHSIVHKYALFICHALVDKDKMLKKKVCIPSGARLANILACFHNIIGLLNMCGAIDGTHYKLYRKSPQSFIPRDYWCRHDICSVLLQGVCDIEKLFGMYVWELQEGLVMRLTKGNLPSTKLMKKQYCKNMLSELEDNKSCLIYVVGDSAYPILAHIQKFFIARTT